MKDGVTKGRQYLNMRNFDMSVNATVGQLTVVVLMGFVYRILVSIHIFFLISSWLTARATCPMVEDH